MTTRDEALLGGPGHDGYAYNADVYCVGCGQALIALVYDERGDEPFTDLEAGDSEIMPAPIFFGEHEVAQHCANCGEYIYGGSDDDVSDL